LKLLIYIKMKNDKHSHFKKEKKENKVQWVIVLNI
jgi:hypothetical protein